MGTVPASGQTSPPTAHLSVAWEVALISALVIVIIVVIAVVVFQLNRKKTDVHGVELGDNARSDRNGAVTPASMSSKKKRKRNKPRKTKARDSVDLESGGVEEAVDFDEDTVSMWMDVSTRDTGTRDAGTRGVSGSESSVEVHKPIR